MRILVLSDSHGDTASMLDAVARESPDAILHLGDCERDCGAVRAKHPGIALRAVRGNCDCFSRELDIDEFVFEGKRFFMTHGHLFGVKTGISRIIHHAAGRNADVLVFGHSHIAHYEFTGSLYVINPGSIAYSPKTYAVIDIYNGKLKCEHMSHGSQQ